MLHSILAFAVICGVLAIASATNGNWTAVASDITGQYLVAASSKSGNYFGYVYVSNNYGATWAPTPFASPWSGVASDGTGQKLVGVVTCTTSGTCNGVWDSADRGATWTQPSKPITKDNYYATSSDEAGLSLLAVGGEGIFHSSNGGSSWGRYNLAEGYNGDVGAVSGSGKVVLIDYKELLTVTSDGGNSWTTLKTPEARWRGVSLSYDGKVLSGAYDLSYESGGNFYSAWYVSTDYGATMTAVKNVYDGEKFYSVSANSDGTYVFCGGSSGIYVYNVATKTVTQSAAPAGGYYSIASSKTGKYVLAASGALWLSSDYGATFKQVY